MKEPTRYDIIGDIHGRFDKLSGLMERLGYTKADEGFLPPAGHRALFLGDLIDPKPGHTLPGGVKATLRAVKAMCDRGDALCLMGNHEFNAVCFHTQGPDGEWLRIRGKGNVRNHGGTLEDFPDWETPDGEWLTVWLPWMKSLPFRLDLGGFRAVHACWHPNHFDALDGSDLHDERFLRLCADKTSPEGRAIEMLLKGLEVDLPEPHSFIDHQGNRRRNFRARWWESPRTESRCCDLVFPPSDQIPAAPADPEHFHHFAPYGFEEPPVFFGHYFKPAGSPTIPEAPNVACLDHSAAKDGPLVAYRWKGESRIKPEHYITSHEN